MMEQFVIMFKKKVSRMDKKKQEVYDLIFHHTYKNMNNGTISNLGMDALNISLDLQMDRSNISRLLNQLHKEGMLIKTQGRPTLFFARSPLEHNDKESYIPNIIPKGKDIMDYIASPMVDTREVLKDDIFRQYIANRNTSSMYEPIQKGKSSLLYPQNGLNMLLYGDPCVGKLIFAKDLYQFGCSNQVFMKTSKFVVLDCLNYVDHNQDEILRKLYGYYEDGHITKGLIELAKHGVLVLNHMDRLSFSILTNIYDSIINQMFSPLHTTNKEVPIRCLIIGISNSEELIKNPDIRRCFPMQVYIPSLREKSIQELLVITMQYIQEEAQRIERTLRISKGALSCFIMSDYSGNLPHLHAEIRQACAHAYCNYLQQESMFVNIDYDDISTPVLTEIYNVNERMNELDNILNVFDNDYLFFSPLKQNQELSMLYDLNDNTQKNTLYVNNIDDRLINQCIQDIDSAINIHLNTIRSVMIKQTYDLLYPILQSNSVCKNENLLYGLLLHLSNQINKVRSGITANEYRMDGYNIAKKEDYQYAKKIMDAVNTLYDVTLPLEEQNYIATYLYLSSQWIENRYIQLLIISENNDSAKDYADYINSQNFKSNISWLRLNTNHTQSDNCKRIVEKMKEINKDKGVVIATENNHVDSYETSIAKMTDIEFVMIPNITLKTLLSVVEKIESLGATIRSLKHFKSEDKEQTTINELTETHAQELLDEISLKVLSESLVFLNPSKVCQSLFNVLLNILHDLKINYTDDLLIKFIFHSGFTIERCIRKEPLVYTKARSIINENDSVYYMIEKDFEIISEIYNVTIPSSEMAMIMEIFLPYMT